MPNKNNYLENLALASLTFLVIIFAQTPGHTAGLNSYGTSDSKHTPIVELHYSATQAFHP